MKKLSLFKTLCDNLNRVLQIQSSLITFFFSKLIDIPLSYLPTPPLGQDMIQGHFFYAELNMFEFRVFHLLD